MQRVSELGGWASIIDVILWITEVYSLNPLIIQCNNNLIDDKTIINRSIELKRLFEILYFLCVNTLHKKKGKHNIQKDIQDNTISPDFNKVIISIVIDVFNKDIRNTLSASRVRDKLINVSPELQTHILEFIVNVIQKYQPAVLICSRDRLWDALFTEHFYYCGYQEGLFKGLELKDDIKKKPQGIKKYYERLHQQVLLFIKFTGALDGHNNIHECVKLINLIDFYYYDPKEIISYLPILDMFLKQNTEITKQSLGRTKTLNIIFDVIKKQKILYHELELLSNDELNQIEYSIENTISCRFSLISFLYSYLDNNNESKKILIENESMIKILLELLYEPDLRECTLRLIILTMSIDNENEFGLLRSFYFQFLELFKIVKEGESDEDFNLILMLLRSLRTLILKSSLLSQNLLRESGAFLKITTVLNTDKRLDRLPELCIEVFKTLLSLMADNDESKEHMEKDIGYDQLVNLVLLALKEDKESKLLHNLVSLMFDLLVDGKFDIDTKYVIQNPDIINFMFKLVLSLPDKQKNELIDKFSLLVSKCPLNQVLCCNQQLIFTLLEKIPFVNQDSNLLQRFCSLIEFLGTHKITVKELKRLFLLLKSERGDFRPLGQIRLMKALQFMALSRTIGPITFFDFNGIDSRLELPTLEKWPRSAGYTFCLWLRVESIYTENNNNNINNNNIDDKHSKKPRIFSFLDQDGNGIECFISIDNSKKSMIKKYFIELLLNNINGKKYYHKFSSETFELGRWYYIIISHANQMTFRLKEPEISLFVNGKRKERFNLKYPQFSNYLNRSCIGSSSNYSINFTNYHYFHGQLGPFILLDESISPFQAKFLYLKSNELLRSGTNCFGELESKLFLYYDSTARSGKMVLDLTPEKSSSSSSSSSSKDNRRMHSIMRGKLHSCESPDIKDTIHCLGGIQVLFPIFAQLDQPIVPLSKNDKINYDNDPDILIQALALLSDMLFMSSTNQQDMLNCEGFQVIGFLLEQSSPEHLTSKSIVTFEDLIHKIQGNRQLEDNFWIYIICRWSIWIYTEYNVQWEILKFIESSIEKDTNHLRRTIGIQKLLDGLYFYYWYNDKGIELQCKEEELYHPVTKRIIGKRPDKNNLKSLRKFFFSSMKLMVLNNGINENETNSIILSLLETADFEQLEELLDFVIELLNLNISGFANQILNIAGIPLFYMLLRSSKDTIVIRSLLIVSKLIKFKDGSSKGSEYLQISEVLDRLNIKIYEVMYNILIGVNDLKPSQINDDNCIRNVYMFPVILSMLKYSDTFLKQKALQDIYLLCSRSDKNCETILQTGRWIYYIIDVIAKIKDDNDENLRIIHELTYNILKALILYSSRSINITQYQVLEQIIYASQYYDSKGLISHQEFIRLLFIRLLKAWRTEISSNSELQHRLDSEENIINLIRFIGLIDEFLFYSPNSNEIKLFQSNRKLLSSSSSSNILDELNNDKSSLNVYSLFKGISLYSLHLSGNNNEKWDDIEVALLLFDMLQYLRFFQNVSNPKYKQLSKQFEKSHELRTSLKIILLKIGTFIIKYGDISACLETVPLIRDLLKNDLNLKKSKGKQSIIYTLGYLLNTLNLIRLSTNGEMVGKTKVLLPIIQDLLSYVLPTLPQSINRYKSNLLKKTYKEFLDEKKAWDCIFNWSNQIINSIENEEKNYSNILDKKFNRNIQPIIQVIQLMENIKQKMNKKTSDSFKNLQKNLLPKEVERKLTLRKNNIQSIALIKRSWRNILRSLTNERGPWASSNNNDDKIYWKLDKQENFSRMRLKLKRNYKFDPHLDAIRDEATIENEEEIEEEPFKLFSGMKLSAAIDDDENETDELIIVDLTSNNDDENLNNEISSNNNNTILLEEKSIYSTSCELITPLTVRPGIFEITNFKLYFKEILPIDDNDNNNNETKIPKELRIPLDQLKGIHLRRYLLRKSALEFFKVDRKNFFINFPKKEREKVYSKIVSLRPPNLTYVESGSPEQILRKMGITKKWQQRQISNFDYLMLLNTIAGRSFNDITQYPVFPWVLKDYISSNINLKDESIYRDLSYPIGALNPDKREGLKIRYEAFDDPNIPKFHHGSHYSSSGIVLFYLIRMEPFTSHFLTLQGGKFDHADRMFHSISGCFNNLLNGSADVKELIPEFYCLPEFLLNMNKFNLGKKQTGTFLDDIILPPWASSPYEFIRINREALESDYVSEHLNEWIDLIFGYKQRGQAAIDAMNIFYYLTYEGAVNLDNIKDENQRRATIAQIDNFGQTPSQLLKKPHPKRNSKNILSTSYFDRIQFCSSPLGNSNSIQSKLKLPGKIFYNSILYPIAIHSDSIAFICNLSYFFSTNQIKEIEFNVNSLITITESRFVNLFKLTNTISNINQQQLQQQQSQSQQKIIPYSLESELSNQYLKIGGPFAADLPIGEHLFACSKDGGLILSCGHWDSSIKCTWINQSRPIQSLNKHKDLVTCIALGVDGKTFVTGSKDTTVLVWNINYQKGIAVYVDETPQHILYGHNGEVTCIAVDIGLDICVSGSQDGTCIIHNLQNGEYLRSLYHPKELPISLVAISSLGHIIFYSNSDLILYVYNINGKLLVHCDIPDRLQQIFIPKSSKYIITTSLDGTISFREIHT